MRRESLIHSIISALREVNDPEIGLNIVDLGLVYAIDVAPDESRVHVQMTLTSPSCPLGEWIAESAQNKIKEKTGLSQVLVERVFEPRWKPEMMSESAKKTF